MRLPNKRQTFWLLMAASAVAVSLPSRVLAPVRGVLDPALAPLSSWLHEGSQSVREQAGQWFIPAGESNPELQDERDAYLVEIVRLRSANRELTTQLAEATGLRDELKTRGRLIPATILARDAVSWREAAMLDVGRNVQIKPKHWALAYVDRGQDASLAAGHLAVLPLVSPQAREQVDRSVMVGQVELVGQVTSRIKLLSDWDSTVLGQVYDPQTDRPGPICSIRGRGPGQPLLAERVEPPRTRAGQLDHDSPPAKPGQLVLTAPNSPDMLGQLLIGVIASVDRVSPVEYSLKITPAIDYAYVRRVFIVDATEPRPQEDR